MIAKYFHLIVLAVLVLTGIFIQSHSITTLTYPFTDEGVYLYASKMVAQGYVIYQDFFLIHLPLWIYINAAILTIVNWNIDLFHFVYVIYVVSGAIPLYLLIYSYSKKITPALVASLVYLTYPEMAQWDMHMFAMRQASLPLLGWALYHLLETKKLRVAAVFMAFFAMSLVTNLLIAIEITIGWCMAIFWESGFTSKIRHKLKAIYPFVIPFAILIAIYYAMFLLIPNAYKNVIGYQLDNQLVNFSQRLIYLKSMLKLNWVIYATGLLGWIFVPKKLRWISLSFFMSALLVIFGSRSFYPHYLVILAKSLSIGTGFLVLSLMKIKIPQLLILVIFVGLLYISTAKHLVMHLWNAKNANFFKVVELLKQSPDPILSFEPIYSLHANKNLTYHYHVADARSFRVLGRYYNPTTYVELMEQSKTVLLDPYTKSLMPALAFKYMHEYFQQSSNVDGVEIWTKKTISK